MLNIPDSGDDMRDASDLAGELERKIKESKSSLSQLLHLFFSGAKALPEAHGERNSSREREPRTTLAIWWLLLGGSALLERS